MTNLGSLLCLETSKKFVVGGGWWWVDKTVNIVFCFGPRLELSWKAGPNRTKKSIRVVAQNFAIYITFQ